MSVLWILILSCSSFRVALSKPIAAQEFPSLDGLKLPNNLPLSINSTTAFNETSLDDGPSIHYTVPGSVTSLLIIPGDPISSKAMRSTLTACRADIARMAYKWGGFSEIWPDPYIFPNQASRYTGLEILVWSIDAHGAGGLTWRQLDAVIQGLQQAMYNNRKYKEAQFMIYDGLTVKAEQGTGELYSVEGPPESAVKEA